MLANALKVSSRRLVVFGVFLVLNCSAKELQWQQDEGFKWAELPVSKNESVGFEKLKASKTGIEFENGLENEQIVSNRHLFDGSGVALGDVDNDGYCDVYFCRLDGSNVLYRNKGNWKFQDITNQAGVGFPGQFSKGALLADIDGDRDLDLIITALGGPNACFLNDGHGKFTEATAEAGLSSLTHRTGNTSMALGDVDGDGDVDLYMVAYKAKAWRDTDRVRFNEQGMVLNRRDYGEPDILYLNDELGHFENVKLKSDTFVREDGRPLQMPRAWGLTARIQDIDDDGDPDIYVCNDFFSPDFIWVNNGRGKFKEIARLAIRSTSLSSMSVDFSDVDRDGDLDFVIADMLSRDHKKRKMQMGVMQGLDRVRGQIYGRPQIMRNTFFLNRGDGTYAEVANFSGLHASDWTWSTIFMDVDLDGYEDLLATTGHAFDVQDSDTDVQIQQRQVRTLDELRRNILLYPRLETPNFAFRNNGDLTFEEKGEDWGFDTNGISHGMALADLDNDGDLDVVVNNYESPAGIYQNKSGAARVSVRLRGLAPNTQAIGAKIKLLGGPVPQSKEVIAGGQYLSSSDPLVVFAAKEEAGSMQLEVIWRNGKRSLIENVQPNRIYEIDESYAKPYEPAGKKQVRPYFEDVSSLLGHQHHERPFDDFYFQPLLPNRLSQLGPGLSWYDIDHDRDDDLVIGSGRDGQLAVYRNDAQAGFVKLASPTLAKKTAQDQTAVLAFDNGSGLTSLLVGASNYENVPEAPSALHYVFKEGRCESASELPAQSSSTGPMVLSDYDNDGDLDLFVGGRLVPRRYPEPASSKLYHNVNGSFELDESNSQRLKEIGLVSGAVFSDIDNDGDPDLILAVEWGPVTVFQNDSGQLLDATERFGLADFYGWWNGVTTGDFNEDGRLDILATNWGLNSKYHYERGQPLKIYYDDFDNDGKLDIVEAYFDPFMKTTVPQRGFSGMSSAIPFIRSNVTSFEQYGGASIQEIIGSGFSGADSVLANTLAHTLFLNRGDRFQAVELPAEAQFSPAFYAGVADFDGDGHEDVFLSQNFFASQPETPRIDAGRGLWLRGNGTGELLPVSGEESGVKVYGEQRGAALSDFDQDGRIDLAVSQNGAATKLYKNIAGKPGLRVRLIGPSANPTGVGAVVQLLFQDKAGPARQIHAGSGYWAQDSAVLVLGRPEPPTGIKIRWPGGSVTESKMPRDVREIAVRFDGKVVSARPIDDSQ